jgi:imidazole glycerol phosphate synthase subunit HisF
MTLARRLCAVLDVDDAGRPARPYTRHGLDATFVEAIAAFMVQDGIDEVWLAAARSSLSSVSSSSTPAPLDVKVLFEPLMSLERRVFAPLVAWAPILSPADARLLLSFGADRVVVDVNRGGADPLGFVERIVEATGPDRVCCAVHARRVLNDKGRAFELVSPSGEPTGINAIGLISELPAVGAAEVLVVPARGPDGGRALHDGEFIEAAAATLHLPLLAHADDVEVADVATALLMGADGVVTRLVSGGRPSFDDVRRALLEYGLPVRG